MKLKLFKDLFNLSGNFARVRARARPRRAPQLTGACMSARAAVRTASWSGFFLQNDIWIEPDLLNQNLPLHLCGNFLPPPGGRNSSGSVGFGSREEEEDGDGDVSAGYPTPEPSDAGAEEGQNQAERAKGAGSDPDVCVRRLGAAREGRLRPAGGSR